MRLVDNLRRTEKKGAMAIRKGVERARGGWGDIERCLRQKMRIYPQKRGTLAMELDESAVPKKNTARKPIISIHGQDLSDS